MCGFLTLDRDMALFNRRDGVGETLKQGIVESVVDRGRRRVTMVSGIEDRLQAAVAERKQDQWRNENKIKTHDRKTRTRSRISLPEMTKRKAEKVA